jgi:hypothetical protein
MLREAYGTSQKAYPDIGGKQAGIVGNAVWK